MKESILEILHKYCSGTIDEQGRCFLSSIFFEKVVNEIENLVNKEKERRENGTNK